MELPGTLKTGNIMNHFRFFCYTGLFILCWLPIIANGQEVPQPVSDIITKSCAFSTCHAGLDPRADLDLSPEFIASSTIGVKSSQNPELMIVKPGDAAKSYIIKKLLGSSDIKKKSMPLDEARLTDQQIRVIAKWIESLPPTLKAKPAKKEIKIIAFPGWTSANLPTTQALKKGGMSYRISHRFNSPVGAGIDELFGLDGGAHMLTQFAFPVTNTVSLSFSRSGYRATYESALKWQWQNQESRGGTAALSGALYIGANWISTGSIIDPDAPDGAALSRTAGERFSYFVQIPISRRNGFISLLAVPGVLVNGNLALADEGTIMTLGLSARFHIRKKYALFVEFVPILANAEAAGPVGILSLNQDGDEIFHDTFSAGLEIKTGGHVFQIFGTNSLGMTTGQYMSGANYDFKNKNSIRVGFNLYRFLNYP